MSNHVFALIVGKSGAGKTTIVNELEKLGYKPLPSYTTRKRRYEGEQGHTFVSHQEFLNLKDLVAYTVFDKRLYGATQQQVAESDTYIVDVHGVRRFIRTYGGDKRILVIHITAPWHVRAIRMLQRGDGLVGMVRRLLHDWKAFKGLGVPDLTVCTTKTAKSCVHDIDNVIGAMNRALNTENFIYKGE